MVGKASSFEGAPMIPKGNDVGSSDLKKEFCLPPKYCSDSDVEFLCGCTLDASYLC